MNDQEIDAIREKFITCEPTYGRWNTDEKKLRAFARALIAKHEQEIIALHAKLAGETLRADQGWQRYEAANAARVRAEDLLSTNHEMKQER